MAPGTVILALERAVCNLKVPIGRIAAVVQDESSAIAVPAKEAVCSVVVYINSIDSHGAVD